MEVIKRKIFLEENIDRNYGSKTWGMLTATTFYLNIQLNQTIDDMGLFTDVSFIPKNDVTPDYTILVDKLLNEGFYFNFMYGITPQPFDDALTDRDELVLRLTNKTRSSYYNFGQNILTGTTDSKINDVRSYKTNQPYIIGFDIDEQTYYNYNDELISGVNRITSLNEPKVYVFDANNDFSIGTDNQTSGIQYKDFSAATINPELFSDGTNLPTTTFRFKSEGINKLNTSLSALMKEEFLLGIISRPEVDNDVFIDRGVVPVLDYHLRLSEIKNLGELEQYGNGYYRIDRI